MQPSSLDQEALSKIWSEGLPEHFVQQAAIFFGRGGVGLSIRRPKIEGFQMNVLLGGKAN